MKVMVISIVVDTFGTVPQRPGTEFGGTGNQRKNQDHPDHSIVETKFGLAWFLCLMAYQPL